MTMPTVGHTAQLSAATHDPKLLRAALALHQERLSEAEPLLKAHLSENPFDVSAIYRSGTGDWQVFVPWLAPHREALSAVADTYPQMAAV
jgi:hypothetical protein